MSPRDIQTAQVPAARHVRAGPGDDLRVLPTLRWSAEPQRLATMVWAGEAIAFSVEYRRALRRRRLDVLLVPLRGVVSMDGAAAPYVDPDHWLVWQSATGTAAVTPLPCDAMRLAANLGLDPANPHAMTARDVLTALISAIWKLKE